MNIETVQFFEYNIRSTVIDDVRMYLVADLLNQYNEKNGVNKKFKNYLKNEQTKSLLENWRVDFVDSNSNLQKCGKSCTSDIEKSVSSNHSLRFSSEKVNKHWSINGVIKYVSFCITTNGGINKGYVICEELLIACLMWADPQFAIAVYTFLKDQRAKDNNFLQQTIKRLNWKNKKLSSRYIPDNKDLQWMYVLKVDDSNPDVIILHSNHKRQTSKCNGKKIQDESIYYVKNLPNGLAFKIRAYRNILNVVRSYGGYSINKQKSTFAIPREAWNQFHEAISFNIRMALKKTRQDLKWRNDLDLDADIQ